MDQAEHSGEEGTSKVLTVPSGLSHCHLPVFLDSLSDQMASRFEILPYTFQRVAGIFICYGILNLFLKERKFLPTEDPGY